ncbi:MAG: hypothetical protein WCT49_04430 [Candidatus Paceibacterota bacterium]|jgi:hypothetical protein|nr:hypothetical protein [Candidatus Paceibacterota bacterium]
MKFPSLAVLTIAAALVLASTFGIESTAPTRIEGTIVGVMPNHATRVKIVYLDRSGKLVKRNTHQSEKITDGNITINPRDYLSIYCKPTCKPYYLSIPM